MDLIWGDASGSALVHAASLGGLDALPLPVPDQGALELGDGAQDLQLEDGQRIGTRGRQEAQALLEEPDLHPLLREAGDEPIKIHDLAREPVHRRDDDAVLVADVGQHRFEGRPVGAGAGALVGEPAVRIPAESLTEGDQLPVGVLAVDETRT